MGAALLVKHLGTGLYLHTYLSLLHLYITHDPPFAVASSWLTGPAWHSYHMSQANAAYTRVYISTAAVGMLAYTMAVVSKHRRMQPYTCVRISTLAAGMLAYTMNVGQTRFSSVHFSSAQLSSVHSGIVRSVCTAGPDAPASSLHRPPADSSGSDGEIDECMHQHAPQQRATDLHLCLSVQFRSIQCSSVQLSMHTSTPGTVVGNHVGEPLCPKA